MLRFVRKRSNKGLVGISSVLFFLQVFSPTIPNLRGVDMGKREINCPVKNTRRPAAEKKTQLVTQQGNVEKNHGTVLEQKLFFSSSSICAKLGMELTICFFISVSLSLLLLFSPISFLFVRHLVSSHFIAAQVRPPFLSFIFGITGYVCFFLLIVLGFEPRSHPDPVGVLRRGDGVLQRPGTPRHLAGAAVAAWLLRT